MRHSIAAEQVNEITEAGLDFVGHQRETSARRVRLERIMGGLEEADAIELERAKTRVLRAKAELYEACVDLERIEEIGQQKAEIRAEMLQLDEEDANSAAEAERLISTSGKAAGFAYAREELIAGGAPALIERRRRVRRAGATRREAEAI